MIGETVSHYRILDKLGGGGMGVVYKAEDVRLGRIVALKFLHAGLTSNEANRKRFLREAQAASLIDHPNVCHVYQVEESEDGRLFIAMAYYGGRSLRAAIEAGPLPPRQAFEIGFSVAQGLWAAHRRGIVHRDIKPGNIVVSDDGFVKIVDFGLALLAGQSRVTTGDARVGTVAYMSPEQASSASVDERTDVWSLGVVMYEMMTGRLPFHGDVDAALLYSIRSEPHTPLVEVDRDVPEACARVVERCLQKKPDDRYANVEALLADMVAAANECGWSDTVASRTIAPILAAKKRRAWRRRAAVAATLAVVVAGGAWLWSRRAPPSPYTTEVRLAVLPLEDHLGSEDSALTDGLSDYVSRVADWVGRSHPSMWTVRHSVVTAALLPDPAAARASFGVNRVITGDVQRYRDDCRLNLVLRDAATQREIRGVAIPFDAAAPTALVNEMETALCTLLGVSRERSAQTPWHCDDGVAASLYLRGLGRTGDDAFAALDSSCVRDSAFALAAAAAGTVACRRYQRTDDVRWLDIAEEHCRKALSLTNDLDDAYALAGDIYLARDQPDSAEAAYRSALAKNPGNLPATRDLARMLVSQSRLDEAESAYRAAVVARPDYWAARRSLGIFYLEQERNDEAETTLRSAVELAPHDAPSLTNLGAVYFRRGNWAEFRELSMQAFRLRPDCRSCNNVATALYFERKFDEAAKYFELALSPGYCDSTDHLAWGNLANALYWTEGQRDQALERYATAIRLARAELESKPDNSTTIGNLIDYYAMSDDTSGARAMIVRAQPFLDDDRWMMYRVGSALEKIGERERALDYLGAAFRHGMPLHEIVGDPTLADLVNDPRFRSMVRSEAAANGAKAAKVDG